MTGERALIVVLVLIGLAGMASLGLMIAALLKYLGS